MRQALRPCRVLLFLVLLLPALAAAQSPEREVPPPAGAVTADAATAPALESPFARAVRQSREVYAAELARLSALYLQAATPADALAIQREITALKQGAEVELMEIQLRFAREAGRTDLVAELEALVGQARAAMAVSSGDAAR